MSDIERVCRTFGLTCAPPRGGGSHFKISHASAVTILTIPHARPVKPVYIRKPVAFVDAVGGSP